MASAPPGWYPDPSGGGGVRWWDGWAWSAHTAPPGWHPQLASGSGWQPGAAPGWPPAAPVDDPAGARRTEERMWRWARAAVVVYAIVAAAELIGYLAVAGQLRHDFHMAFDGTAAQPAGLGGLPAAWSLLELGELVMLAAGIVFLVWQHSAATVARAVGYPARTSPGFGVAAWFIPIVNFWFPYWALSRCLPPAHPLQERGLLAWSGYVVGGVLVGAAEVVGFFSTGAAAVVGVLAIASVAIAATLGWRLVGAIEEDHRRAVAAVADARPARLRRRQPPDGPT